MPKVPINYDPGEPNLRPAQQILPTPYAPKLPGAAMFPFKELADLAPALAKITLQQQERDNEVQRQAGEQDFIDELAAAHKQMDGVEAEKTKNQTDYLKAEKEGKVTPAQNPWRKVGYSQAAARDVMSHYQSDLVAAQSKATGTRDQNGQLVPAQDPDAIIADVWSKYADNPVFKGYYGSKVAVNQKQTVDSAFRQDAAQGLAANQAKETQRGLNNNVGQWMVEHGLKQDVTPESIDNLETVVNDGRLHGSDQYEALKSGMDLAATSFGSADTGHGASSSAADALRRFRGLKVGNTTVEKDAKLGPYLENLIDRADSEFERKTTQAVNGISKRRALKYDQEEHNILGIVSKMKAAGNTSAEVDAAIKARQAEIRQNNLYTDENGDDSLEVAQHLTAFSDGLLAEGNTDTVRQLTIALSNGADTSAVRQSALTALQNREISTGQYNEFLGEIEKHTNALPVLKGPAVSTFLSQLDAAAKIPDLPTGAGIQFGRNSADTLATVFTELNAEARRNSRLPQDEQDAKMSEWTTARLKPLQAEFRAAADEFSAERASKIQEAQAALTAGKPIPPQLIDSEHFSEREVTDWADAQKKVQARNQYIDDPHTLNLRNVGLEAELEKQKAEYLGQPPPPDRKAELINKYGAALDSRVRAYVESLQATKQPGEVAYEFQKGLPTVFDEFSKDVQKNGVPGYHPNLPATAQRPTGETEKVASADIGFQSQAGALFQASADEYGKVATATRHPSVPAGVYNTIQSALSGTRRGLFNINPPATITDARESAVSAAQALQTRTDVGPEDKKAAILSLVTPLGIDPDTALAGKAALTHPPELIAATQARLQALRAEQSKFSRTFQDPLTRGQIATLQAKMDALGAWHAQPPVEVEIKAGDINPYTTPLFPGGVAQLNLWQKTRPDDLRKLSARYGVPDEQYERWQDDQLTLARKVSNAR